MPSTVSKHHDDSLYYECLAKKILESKFKNLKFEVLDKPDLQDKENKIGVEVTQILPLGCNQAVSLMQKERNIDGNLSDSGYKVPMTGILFHPCKSWTIGNPFPAFDYLVCGIQKKINKVKMYKNGYKEVELYVFTDNLEIDIETLQVLFKKILEINTNAFNNIFIDACYKIFHLKNEYAGIYEINKDLYTSYQNEAIKMEEDIKNE